MSGACVCVLLSYHGRLRMTVRRARGVRVNDGRVGHSWYTDVVSHGCGVVGWGRDGGGG